MNSVKTRFDFHLIDGTFSCVTTRKGVSAQPQSARRAPRATMGRPRSPDDEAKTIRSESFVKTAGASGFGFGFGDAASVELATDERTAGELWRREKFKDFRWRARCAGVDKDPAVAAELEKMVRLTMSLNEMSTEQRERPESVPWWRDGEYDETRAEDANDRGMEAMRGQAYEEAFDAFTEAIRLEPRKAVYHANRAAAGIKLERFRAAAEDAECAIERDAKYVKALLRAGTANLKLRLPDKALEMFDSVLTIDPDNEKAIKGRQEAEHAAAAASAEVKRQEQAALHGARPALPRRDIDEEIAAESLLSAEGLLRANPNFEGAKANVAEALVQCQRYEMALERCKTLMEDSLDRKYIVAETRLRMGDVDGALAEISSASFRDSYDCFACKKCVELGGRILHLQDLIQRAERDCEDGQYSNAIRLLDQILRIPEGSMKTWLRGRILRKRAECVFKLHEYDSVNDETANTRFAKASKDLTECIALNGRDYETFILRASMCAARGDHHNAFTDLRFAQTLAPTYPGIDNMVRTAASKALRTNSPHDIKRPTGTGHKIPNGGKFYDILGIKPDADAKAVKSAYRKLATVWHPDKWVKASEEEAAKAEKTFKSLQRAYTTLSDPKQRKMYDLDPHRFDEVDR